jgi:hypothetical protein
MHSAGTEGEQAGYRHRLITARRTTVTSQRGALPADPPVKLL